jgi:hypothetical protein
MEPMTTVALLLSLAGAPMTAMPAWPRDKAVTRSTSGTTPPLYLSGPQAPQTEYQLEFSEDWSADAAIPLLDELTAYTDLQEGWDGPGSRPPSLRDIERAFAFVSALPSAIPLPKTMLSPSGTLGLFWDNGMVFADLQFEGDDVISLFTKNRENGREKYEEVFDNQISSDWCFDRLAELTAGMPLAA